MPGRATSVLEPLLSGAVDYAGLFPPASLSMAEVVKGFRTYRRSRKRWLLGRFVVPVSRLEEFGAVALRPEYADDEPWRLSVLLPGDADDSLRCLERFLTRWDGEVRCTALEVAPVETSRIEALASRLPEGVATYFELPPTGEATSFMAAVRHAGARVKIRTGGVVAESIPSSRDLAAFLRRCHDLGLAFKATAGLHHPLRTEAPLSGETNAPRATMHGFVNLALAAALVHARDVPVEIAAAALEARRDEMSFDDTGAHWRDHRLGAEELRQSHESFFQSFGSCSFSEPVRDLEELCLS